MRDDDVLLCARTPSARQDLQRAVPSELSVAEALNTLLSAVPRNEGEREAIDCLRAEMGADEWHVFAILPAGKTQVEPRRRVGEIAVPYEHRTESGLVAAPTAWVEVQAYAGVAEQ